MSLVVIAGRLGKDASVETTSGGTKVVKFSVVENEYKNGEETSVWYDVTSFNPFIIEKQIKALKKGSFIVAPADLTVRASFSKSGQLYLNYDAIVSSLKVINVNGNGGTKKNESSSENNDSEVTTGSVEKPVVKQEKPVDVPKTYVEEDKDDDLPF